MTHTDLERDEATTAKRIKQARKQFAVTRWAPDVDVVHPVHVTRPEESLPLLPLGRYLTLIRAPMGEYHLGAYGLDHQQVQDAFADYQRWANAMNS